MRDDLDGRLALTTAFSDVPDPARGGAVEIRSRGEVGDFGLRDG